MNYRHRIIDISSCIFTFETHIERAKNPTEKCLFHSKFVASSCVHSNDIQYISNAPFTLQLAVAKLGCFKKSSTIIYTDTKILIAFFKLAL